MKDNILKYFLITNLIFFAVVIFACNEPVEFNNPFDPEVPLSSPTDLSIVSIAEESFTLQWKSNVKNLNSAQANEAQVIIEQSIDGMTYVAIDSIEASSSIKTIQKPFDLNVTFYFRIILRVGNRKSAYSNIVNGTASYIGPSQAKVTYISETERRITWKDNTSIEAEYDVERKLGKNGAYTAIGTLPPNSTSFTDNSIIRTNTLYYYRVFALTSKGTRSTIDSFTVSISFQAPSNLTCSGDSSNVIHLQWTNSFQGLFSTVIERSVNNSSFSMIATLDTNIIAYTDNQVDRTKNYSYRLHSFTPYNSSSNSTLSANYQCRKISNTNISIEGHANGSYMETCKDGSIAFCLNERDGIIDIIDLKKYFVLQTLSFSQVISKAALNSNGSVIGIALRDSGVFYIYSTSSGQLLQKINSRIPVMDLVISSDGTTLITSSTDNMIRIWNIADGTLLRSLSGHNSSPISLWLLDNGLTLVSGADSTVKFWDWQSGSQIMSISGGYFSKPLYEFSDGHIYWIDNSYSDIFVRDLTFGTISYILHNAYPQAALLSSDGLTLVEGGTSRIVVYNLLTNAIASFLNTPFGPYLMVTRTNTDSFILVGTKGGNGFNSPKYLLFGIEFGWVSS